MGKGPVNRVLGLGESGTFEGKALGEKKRSKTKKTKNNSAKKQQQQCDFHCMNAQHSTHMAAYTLRADIRTYEDRSNNNLVTQSAAYCRQSFYSEEVYETGVMLWWRLVEHPSSVAPSPQTPVIHHFSNPQPGP